MGGVSGAFLLLPFQMSFLGYTNPSVSATNHLFNIVAIPSGVYRYIKEGRMVWPLTWTVVIGTLPGVLIGAIVRVRYLPDPKNFKLFAALVLLFIGARMLRDLACKPKENANKATAERKFPQLIQKHRTKTGQNTKSLPTVLVTRFDIQSICYQFYGEEYRASSSGIFMLSLVVGIIGGIYGIGGGAIIAPFLVSFYGLPVYTVAGAALMGTFVTSVTAVLFYQLIAPLYPNMSIAPDWLLGFLFGVGGMVGMYLGARSQKLVPAIIIKWMLCAILIFTACKYIFAFFK